MLKNNTASYDEIRGFLDRVPVIETHEHYTGITEPIDDAIRFLTGDFYYISDLLSAAFGRERQVSEWSNPACAASVEEKLAQFLELDRKANKTAYSRGMRLGLRECWGVEDITAPGALQALGEKLKTRDQAFYERTMERLGIRAKVVDIFNLKPYVEGKAEYTGYCRFAFSLPAYHDIHGKADILRLDCCEGRTITCLDDYLACFEAYFKRCVDFGIVCVKDQTAYRRTLAYGNPTRAEAEKAFNDMMNSPREVFGDDRARPLDDWLFHHYLRLAAKYNLPVQVHTGHMAGIRNELGKTNALHLTPVLELHQDVRFDLFHGNWPFMDEFLFLGKNYPNVWLNLCWAQSIDPIYCVELMKRAVMTVPHAKLFAFGGDTGCVEWAAGYLLMARDNVACALSELVDSGWIGIGEAREIAADWFFNNPNEFFGLGFEPFRP